MFLIDTSLVIGALERRDPAAIEALASTGGPTKRSVFVLGELQSGVEAATKADLAIREQTRDGYLTLTVEAEPIPLSDLAATFALATATAARNKVRIGQTDRWIIAEGLATDAQILTMDATMHHLGQLITAEHDRAGSTVLIA